MPSVTIIGGGLAGSEAAWQLAQRNIEVVLVEMKPTVFSPAHHEPHFAELVCSNSFGSKTRDTGAGLLQSEALALGSFILTTAFAHEVPAGRALAVDRATFSSDITRRLESHPRIHIERRQVTELPNERPLLVCTGPLTAEALSSSLQTHVGCEHLYFFDAISPIILGESIDRAIVFSASRYEDGPGDYLNCPMNREEYHQFVESLQAADLYPAHAFEHEKLFHGCQPIEAMARSGLETLAFGPMRPVGLIDPRSGKRPYAVVQLRREDAEGQLWNMVGFQTRMRHGEQTKILRTVPGLADAEFVRLGSIHRNTFLNAPTLLTSSLMLRSVPGVYLGGQITGVEGYLESSVCGLMAALFIAADLNGVILQPPPPETMIGGLLRYLRESQPSHFQPMNSNFGLLPPLAQKVPKSERRQRLSERAAQAFCEWNREIPAALKMAGADQRESDLMGVISAA